MTITNDILALFRTRTRLDRMEIQPRLPQHTSRQICSALKRLNGCGKRSKALRIVDYKLYGARRAAAIYVLGEGKDMGYRDWIARKLDEKLLLLFERTEGLTEEQVTRCVAPVMRRHVRSAIERLRGKHGGKRQIRVIGYKVSRSGVGNFAPIFAPGTQRDVHRHGATVRERAGYRDLDQARQLRQARSRFEERTLLRETDRYGT